VIAGFLPYPDLSLLSLPAWPGMNATSTLYLDNTAHTPTWRQFDPYGNPRGPSTPWIDNRAFLNKPTDTVTGLDGLGARRYDPVTGQFNSPDPILIPTNPQDLNPYAYALDNPVSATDPTGLVVMADPGSLSGCSDPTCGNEPPSGGPPPGGSPNGNPGNTAGNSQNNIPEVPWPMPVRRPAATSGHPAKITKDAG
jgi:RHS repeat-associated protein